MKQEMLQGINLTLFDGGTAPAGAATGQASAGDTGGSAGQSQNTPSVGKRGKQAKGEVLYGKQTGSAESGKSGVDGGAEGNGGVPLDQTGGQGQSQNPEDEFQSLIKGQYKDAFAKEVKRIINDRFKAEKSAETRLNEVNPVLDALMTKYGIKDGDLAKLSAAIESDNAYWETAAEEAGLTVDQYKEIKRIEAENARMSGILERQKQQAVMDRIVQGWQAEAETLKATIPDFDLQREMANPTFADLLSRKIPMETAYEIVHLDDIKAGAAKQAERKVANTVRANASRPAENGVSASQSAFTVKDDPSQLTREDRREIARRVARGEQIAF